MNKDFESRELDLPRPVDYMKNPFIGDDGKDYHSFDALKAANQAHFEQTHYFISSVLDREYPPTLLGAAQMRQDEAAHRKGLIMITRKFYRK